MVLYFIPIFLFLSPTLKMESCRVNPEEYICNVISVRKRYTTKYLKKMVFAEKKKTNKIYKSRTN